MKRRVFGAIAFAAYVTAAIMPMERFWFDPSVPVFADTQIGSDPPLTFSRHIKSPVSMSYAVTLRNAETRDVVCSATGGPFQYLPEKSGPQIGKTLSWFASNDRHCDNLQIGTYYGEVTWIAAFPLQAFLPDILDVPLGWIIPPKSVTREIPPFKILPVEVQP